MTGSVRIGTRSSPLARWQAEWVARGLEAVGCHVELVWITTQGDVRSEPIGALGGQGLFTKEIQRALLDRRVDLAVHSLKDLPTESVEGLMLGAVPPRESPGDALVASSATFLADLPAGARVGTGSTRRRAQLLHARPDLVVDGVRGNVETRLAKLDAGQFDALVLAESGLNRLGLRDRIRHVLPRELMLPAVGQGALGLEIRADDRATADAVAALDDPATHAAVVAERALLRGLRGGCLAPVGAWGRVEGQALKLDAVVLSGDGRERLFEKLACELPAAGELPVAGPLAAGAILTRAAELGGQLAGRLLDRGAERLVQAARDQTAS